VTASLERWKYSSEFAAKKTSLSTAKRVPFLPFLKAFQQTTALEDATLWSKSFLPSRIEVCLGLLRLPQGLQHEPAMMAHHR
jgi:hypothetical protein